MSKPTTVVFWGAGATARLGMRTTAEQSRFIVALTGAAEDAPIDLTTRVEDAFGGKADARQRQLVVDLLTILGDGVALEEMHTAGPEQLAAMRRNCRSGADNDALSAATNTAAVSNSCSAANGSRRAVTHNGSGSTAFSSPITLAGTTIVFKRRSVEAGP